MPLNEKITGNDPADGSRNAFQSAPRPRRLRAGSIGRRSAATGVLVAGGVGLLLLLAYFFMAGDDVEIDVIDFAQSVERIEEVSTVKSHIRFGVVVREEGGNVIVRRLADQVETLGMNGLGDALFESPTMIVELHGVATYGVQLDDLRNRISQDDSTVRISLPQAKVLDAKLIAADTKIVARMKGLFRSANDQLILEASQRGESFVKEYAEQDTAMISLASQRARDLLALLVEQGGKKASFR
jgi:hypothetical protein